MEPGLSHRNPRVVEAARLHRSEERARQGLTLLEGPHLVQEALRAGVALHVVFALPSDRDWSQLSGVEVVTVSEEALKRLSSTRTPQSPVAVMEIPSHHLDPSRSFLVAWQISDPGNLGTMIRTSAAFGLDVAVTPGSTDPWSPKVLRAAMGGHFRTAVAPVEDVSWLEVTKVAAVMSGGVTPRAMPGGRLALLLGSEAHGLPDDVATTADIKVTIPMPGGTESLNAASAAAILAYEASRKRSEG